MKIVKASAARPAPCARCIESLLQTQWRGVPRVLGSDARRLWSNNVRADAHFAYAPGAGVWLGKPGLR